MSGTGLVSRAPSVRRGVTVREMKKRALRGRQSGAGLKPPQAAVVKSDRGTENRTGTSQGFLTLSGHGNLSCLSWSRTCMVFGKGVRTPEVSIMTAMNPTDEFLRHAADCEQMAKFTRDPASKATWNQMAERWLQCAERSKSQSFAAHQHMPAKRYRNPAASWAHH